MARGFLYFLPKKAPFQDFISPLVAVADLAKTSPKLSHLVPFFHFQCCFLYKASLPISNKWKESSLAQHPVITLALWIKQRNTNSFSARGQTTFWGEGGLEPLPYLSSRFSLSSCSYFLSELVHPQLSLSGKTIKQSLENFNFHLLNAPLV